MEGEQLLENLTPLGYLIVSATAPTIYDTPKLYYGVERQHWFLPTDPRIREFFGEALEEDPVVAAAIDEWHALQDEPYFTPITPDYEQAVRLMRILGTRAPLELLFCELAWSPGEEERLLAYRPFLGQPRNITITYGYDASWRECNYSVILHIDTDRQVTPAFADMEGVLPVSSGYIPIVPDAAYWKGQLNEWGLLRTYAEIRALRERFKWAYPDANYDIFRVHRVQPDA